jgi:hypothetical protein
MSRRIALLIATLASLAIVGCNTAPVAPPLSDPKEILVQSIGSMQGAKTMQLSGSFGGNLNASGMGQFDLSTVKLTVAADVEGKKARITLDAPTLLGTAIDVITLEDSVFMKMTGPLAAMAGMDATGKYLQMPVDSGAVPDEATDPVKALEELRKSLDDLPAAPEKLADEKIGDADAYHVRLSLSGEQLGELSPEAGTAVGDVSLDIWSRKSDVRPVRIGFSVDAGEQGTVTGTFDLTYDAAVNIAAPPADQVVPAP